jgi:hypothetical protein
MNHYTKPKYTIYNINTYSSNKQKNPILTLIEITLWIN